MKAFRQTILFVMLAFGLIDAGNAGIIQKRKMGIDFLKSAQEKTEEVNRLVDLGYKYLKKSKTVVPEVKQCIDSALLICTKEGITTPSSLHLLTAEYNFRTGNYKSASEEANLAVKKADDTNDNEALAKAMLFLGAYYFRTSFFNESLDYYTNSIDIARKHNIKGIIYKAYSGQGQVYSSLGDMLKYKATLEKQISTAAAEKDTTYAIDGYYTLGTLLCAPAADDPMRNFRAADSLLNICYFLAMVHNDSVMISSSLANKGWNYYLAKMYDPALAHFKKSLTYSVPAKIHSAAANSYGNIGNIFRDIGNNEQALNMYKKGLDQAYMVRDFYSLGWIYKDVSDLYLGIKDTAKAFDNFVLHKKYNDSLLIYRSTGRLTDARLRYETDSNIKELELLSLRIRNQRTALYGFLAVIVLGVVIGWLLFRASRLQAKRRMSELNRKMAEIRQANLRQQMNPHFIFNTLNSIQYYMYQHDKLATNNYLTKFSNLMRKVLDNSQHDSIPLSDELNALTLYLELETIRFKDKFDYEIHVDDEIDTMLYKVPTMLIQPYVENSICHGLMPLEGKGSVKIDIRLKEDHLLCRIEDNGIGREAAQERKASKGVNHNSLGTQIAVTRLDLVNELYGTSLKTKYTDLKGPEGEPAGTLVEIHIPILT